MPHRPLVNLVAWQEPERGRPRAAVTLQFTTISFDVSFQKIFTTLATWFAAAAIGGAEEPRVRSVRLGLHPHELCDDELDLLLSTQS